MIKHLYNLILFLHKELQYLLIVLFIYLILIIILFLRNIINFNFISIIKAIGLFFLMFFIKVNCIHISFIYIYLIIY